MTCEMVMTDARKNGDASKFQASKFSIAPMLDRGDELIKSTI